MVVSKRGNRKANQSGFTLLEVLVVLTIVGITIAGVQLAFSGSEARRLDQEAERFMDFFAAARTDAILESRAIEVVCDDAGCRRTSTTAAPEDVAVRAPAGVALSRLEIDGRAGAAERLVFDPTGEAAGFELDLSLGDHALRLRGDANGEIRTERLHA